MKKFYKLLFLGTTLFVLVFAVSLSPAHAQTSTAAPTSGASNFVSLTQLPAISSFVSGNQTFTTFFNSLYEYCVGAAAALAFLMIVWAGVTWMSAGDSAEQVSQAKKRIQDALFGLILVLSPAIVFGIINPGVLTLSPNFSGLQTNISGSATPAPAAPQAQSIIQATGQVNPACTPYANGAAIDDGNNSQVQCCDNQTPGNWSVAQNPTTLTYYCSNGS